MWADAALEGESRSERWQSDVRPTHCPKLDSTWSYAFNASLAGCKITEISDPARTPLVFSAKGSKTPTSGGFGSFDPEHAERGTIAFADGSADLFDLEGAERLKWLSK